MADKKSLEEHIEPGILIRTLRLEAGYTQEQLGKLIDVGHQNICWMEKGKRPIGKNIAKKLAGLFEVDYRRFL